jgi:hypothetical protein
MEPSKIAVFEKAYDKTQEILRMPPRNQFLVLFKINITTKHLYMIESSLANFSVDYINNRTRYLLCIRIFRHISLIKNTKYLRMIVHMTCTVVFRICALDNRWVMSYSTWKLTFRFLLNFSRRVMWGTVFRSRKNGKKNKYKGSSLSAKDRVVTDSVIVWFNNFIYIYLIFSDHL